MNQADAKTQDGAPGVTKSLPTDFFTRLDQSVQAAGGEWQTPPDKVGAVGFTMFDSSASEDNTVTILLPSENIGKLPSQSLVRIKSDDGRVYQGVVVNGPFAEADGLRADSNMLVVSVTRGGILLPKYHGRVQVEITGEERDGVVMPPRFRPLPNSAVFTLDPQETAEVLQVGGDMQLGVVVGQEDLVVHIPSHRKSVLPRHTAVLGTTGGGKSTTVSRLIAEAQRAGLAVVVIDVEGEYTYLHEPTDDPQMLGALQRRGLTAQGVPQTALRYLVGRDTANPDHPDLKPFSLEFAHLSPYTTMDILDLTEAQQQRFLKAYDIAKQMLRELDIYPRRGDASEEQAALEHDEFEEGYPRLTLGLLISVVWACSQVAEKAKGDEIQVAHPALREKRESLLQKVHAGKPDSPVSWRALGGKLGRLNRLRVLDNRAAGPLDCAAMLQAGQVTIIDLSDTGAPVLNNLVIADVLRGIARQQEDNYTQAKAAGQPVVPTLIIIEEAHEFLSAKRIEKMQNLFQQVERIARRGRKRWLGLVFVTQAPEHLPQELLSLINNFVLHKIKGERVVSALSRSIGGVDEGLWQRLPNLAPGQAIVSFMHLSRPLLVAVDPTPVKLRMVE
ncbi:MAG: ATP-binding protein [Anaerolineae bacterium]|nr:ATP-binding protein [Anaerolineae bacterium]